jgi:hypothetical protein
MILRIFGTLGLIAALLGCSIERDIPDFSFPASSVDTNGDFPKLLPIHQLQSTGAADIPTDTATLDNLEARVAALRSKYHTEFPQEITPLRIKLLRARARALMAATF